MVDEAAGRLDLPKRDAAADGVVVAASIRVRDRSAESAPFHTEESETRQHSSTDPTAPPRHSRGALWGQPTPLGALATDGHRAGAYQPEQVWLAALAKCEVDGERGSLGEPFGLGATELRA